MTPEDALKLLLSKLDECGIPYMNVAKIQGDHLDRAYLEQWAGELDVLDLLEKFFEEMR